MSRFGAGIRRGVMAADQFTQIANGLFRDPRLSSKAKGNLRAHQHAPAGLAGERNGPGAPQPRR